MIDEMVRKLQEEVSVNSNSFFLPIMIHKLPNAHKHDLLTNEIIILLLCTDSSCKLQAIDHGSFMFRPLCILAVVFQYSCH